MIAGGYNSAADEGHTSSGIMVYRQGRFFPSQATFSSLRRGMNAAAMVDPITTKRMIMFAGGVKDGLPTDETVVLDVEMDKILEAPSPKLKQPHHTSMGTTTVIGWYLVWYTVEVESEILGWVLISDVTDVEFSKVLAKNEKYSLSPDPKTIELGRESSRSLSEILCVRN